VGQSGILHALTQPTMVSWQWSTRWRLGWSWLHEVNLVENHRRRSFGFADHHALGARGRLQRLKNLLLLGL